MQVLSICPFHISSLAPSALFLYSQPSTFRSSPFPRPHLTPFSSTSICLLLLILPVPHLSLSFCPPPQLHPFLRASAISSLLTPLIADIISGSLFILQDDIYHPAPPYRLYPLAAPHLFCSLAASLLPSISTTTLYHEPLNTYFFFFQINQILPAFSVKCGKVSNKEVMDR